MWGSVDFLHFMTLVSVFLHTVNCQDIIGCGGFVKSEVEINFSHIEVKLYTKQGSLKYQTDCAPNNGYYMIPIYDKGEYVLKVEPPPGWTFEPQSYDLQIDGKTDLCSTGEDINFEFTGFGVVGKVVSLGQSVGPLGISLALRKPGEIVLKRTVSTHNGAYTFERVLPGEYVVEGSHPKWQFECASTAVTVGRETGSASKDITVHGYDVTGEVTSEGSAVEGVQFVLFSNTADTKSVRGCTTGLPSAFPSSQKPGGAPICYVTSDASGRIAFGSVPVGDYAIVPFYQGEHITFDVVPARLQFSVPHHSVKLPDKFIVAGFSVSGKVLTSAKGEGVAGAAVWLSGMQQTVTGASGVYRLESMTAGTYTLTVRADRMTFDDTTVKITSSTPHLPDIVAARFSVCGRILIDKLPAALSNTAIQHKVKVTQKGDDKPVAEVTSSKDGGFCADLKPGTYICQIVLTETEIKAGLRLAPIKQEFTVKNKPLNSIIFSQFRASVKGKLSCLEHCGSLQLSLAATTHGDERYIVDAETSNKQAKFHFQNILPGKYKVSILNEGWCWQQRALDVEVVDRDVDNLEFIHNGYILTASLSHDITLNFEQDGKPGNIGSFNLTAGTNKFCLSEPGVYTLLPRSCRRFEHEKYKYDTSRPSQLSLTAVRHLVEGLITTEKPYSDIAVTIQSSFEEKPIKLGTLTSDKKTPTTYSFNYWARSGEKLEIIASSAILLFYPPSVSTTVSGTSCPGLVAQIEGRPGTFLSGAVKPALSGVKITITAEGKEDVITLETDKQGTYKVGPLHSDRTYSVNAEKEGYVLSRSDSGSDFNAFKLGEIRVQVQDEGAQPLTGVLLSLSGGPSNYRSNQLSQADGTMVFLGLSPGQYFLRLMMKEYKFEPSSQMIEVTEGSTVKLRIHGTRIAYSCYGSVTSLNGEPEPGVLIEAVGRGDSCQQLQEDAHTEADGSFRIRGLQPNCEYNVHLKHGDNNPHIERTAPQSHPVKATTADIMDVNIIAFRRMSQMELSGNVLTEHKHLLVLKVELYRDNEPDSPLHTVKLETTSFFHLPSLIIDNQSYTLRLTSTLSRLSYTYELTEISFTANSTYRHFSFTFDPKPKTVEQDLNQSSFLILPLTALVVFLSYNSKQVLPILSQLFLFLQGIFYSLQRPSSRSSSPAPAPISPELLMPTPKHKVRKT